MKTVEFKLAETSVFEYWCSCCGDSAEIDHSGTYVLASEAQAEISELKGRNLAYKQDFKKLVDENEEALERERVLVAALKAIARQKLESEMPEEDAEHADFNEGYDSIVRVARAALAAKEE